MRKQDVEKEIYNPKIDVEVKCQNCEAEMFLSELNSYTYDNICTTRDLKKDFKPMKIVNGKIRYAHRYYKCPHCETLLLDKNYTMLYR